MTIDPSKIHVPEVAIFAALGLFPAYFLTYLASRARRAQGRFRTSKCFYVWALSRVAFLLAIPVLAAGWAVAWAAGAAVATPFLQSLVLTLMVSFTLGLAGGCVLHLLQAISGPEREKMISRAPPSAA